WGMLGAVSEARTLPYGSAGLPIRTLAVEITEGLNAGVSRMADSDTLTVGTAEGNDLVVTDPTVSRYHLELTRRPGGIQVIDAGSSNGTLIGTVRVERALVPP